MYAVAGVTGRVGAATADGLLKRGQKVRVLVRDEATGEAWKARRCDVAIVDLLDEPSMVKALQGLAGVFLLLPTPPPGADYFVAQDVMTKSLAAAVSKSKVASVAFLSSIGAQHPAGTGPITALHRAELALTGTAPSVTFVRAALALERWEPLLLGAMDSGTLPVFGNPHLAMPQIGAKDVGTLTAEAMELHKPGPRVLEIAGASNWSAEEVAAALTSLLKQPIKAIEHPADTEVAFHVAAGMAPMLAEAFAERSRAQLRGLLQFSHPHEVKRGTTSLFETLSTLV